MLRLALVETATLELPLLLVGAPAGFPSPAQDGMEERIDLDAWLLEHSAASYVMRVEEHSMAGRYQRRRLRRGQPFEEGVCRQNRRGAGLCE